MKKPHLKLTALCLVLALLLSGCVNIDFAGYLENLLNVLTGALVVSFEDMEYTRPDTDTLLDAIDSCRESAATETDLDTLMDEVYDIFEGFYQFHTAYCLSNIHYCKDLTDTYWEEEYNYCMDHSSEVQAAMDQLLYTLADSPLREQLESEDYFGAGYFDDYEGDSLWTEEFTGLMDQESQLVTRYYTLTAQSAEYDVYSEEFYSTVGADMAQLFLELVQVRQQIAASAGYASYPEFAYDFYYNRDYTPDQAAAYMSDVQTELKSLYRNLSPDVWDTYYAYCSEEDTFAYAQECANAMGGTIADAFALMEEANLYDISYSENKYNASFEVFLLSYGEPYIFVNPQMTNADKLTFVHEFGHFCNDYASYGSVAGVDVAEIFSQAMEYLSLCYCEDTEDLARMKMADSLCVFVEQSIYASFEQQVYGLTGEDLTAKNVQALFQQTGNAFGLDGTGWDSRMYVLIPHFFTSPLYVISYVVSNDAAMQFYQLELASQGAGLTLYEQSLSTMESDFLAFVESAGLQSPFAEGRVKSIRETMEQILR